MKELQKLEMELLELAKDGSFIPIIPRKPKRHVIVTSSHGIAPCEDTEIEIVENGEKKILKITHEYLVAPITSFVSIKAKCIGIIGTYNREFSNLDRIEEMKGYHKALLKVIKFLRRYGDVVILSIHGWDDEKKEKKD